MLDYLFCPAIYKLYAKYPNCVLGNLGQHEPYGKDEAITSNFKSGNY